MIQESDYLLYRLDPSVWATEVLGIQLDGWQIEVVRSKSKRLLLNCSRRSGKSYVSAILALWQAVFYPGSEILCISPKQDVSSELLSVITKLFRQVDGLTSISESQSVLKLSNGSRIKSLPGVESAPRGLGASLLIVDEASRCLDELWEAALPVLANTEGRALLLSTPNGTRGFFYKLAIDANNAWEKWEIPSSKCPRISKETVDSYRSEFGSFKTSQEFECCFIDGQTQMFSREHIDNMFNNKLKGWEL